VNFLRRDVVANRQISQTDSRERSQRNDAATTANNSSRNDDLLSQPATTLTSRKDPRKDIGIASRVSIPIGVGADWFSLNALQSSVIS